MIVEQLSWENTKELNPASAFTQRWRTRQLSWRHVSEGGFDKSHYEVALVPDDTSAKEFIETHHYSGSYPAAVHRFGLFERGQKGLVGIGVLSVPPSKGVLTRVFPSLEAYTESLELGRFVLLDRVPANAESWFLARVWELAVRLGVRGVVSFSDPLPRTTAQGTLVFPGHVGTIYQATNAQYLGRSARRSLLLLPNGHVFHARTMQKIRAQEVGAAYCEKILTDLGACPRASGEDPGTWLRQALYELGARKLSHPGNHRYAFRIGPARRKITLPLISQPYPKTR